MKTCTTSCKLLMSAAVILTGLSFFSFKHSIAIHIHSFYFFISQTQLLWLAALLVLCLWTFYKMSGSLLLSPVLTAIHTSIAVLTIAVIVTIPLWGNELYLLTSRRYYEYSEWGGYHYFGNLHIVFKKVVFIILVGHIPFMINVAGGFIKKCYLSNRLQALLHGERKFLASKRNDSNNNRRSALGQSRRIVNKKRRLYTESHPNKQY